MADVEVRFGSDIRKNDKELSISSKYSCFNIFKTVDLELTVPGLLGYGISEEVTGQVEHGLWFPPAYDVYMRNKASAYWVPPQVAVYDANIPDLPNVSAYLRTYSDKKYLHASLGFIGTPFGSWDFTIRFVVYADRAEKVLNE